MNDFIKRIQFLRKENGLSLIDLSEKLGIHCDKMRLWETGIAIPPIEICTMYSEIFSIDKDSLLELYNKAYRTE